MSLWGQRCQHCCQSSSGPMVFVQQGRHSLVAPLVATGGEAAQAAAWRQWAAAVTAAAMDPHSRSMLCWMNGNTAHRACCTLAFQGSKVRVQWHGLCAFARDVLMPLSRLTSAASMVGLHHVQFIIMSCPYSSPVLLASTTSYQLSATPRTSCRKQHPVHK